MSKKTPPKLAATTGRVLTFKPRPSDSNPTSAVAAIETAIEEKRLLEFVLDGLRRIAEPHVYGIHRGRNQLLFYQVEGESRSGGLPYWRRTDTESLTDLRVLDRTFKGAREKGHGAWDEILLTVE